jgi:hypothetical protein
MMAREFTPDFDADQSAGPVPVLAWAVPGSRESIMRSHGKIPQSPRPLARRMTALGLNVAAVARSEPSAFGDLRIRCANCRCLERCAHDLQCDPAGPMRYCPNDGLLNFLSEMWWLRTLL